MRLPTFQVVDGIVDPISTHGDSIRLVGAGFAQPIPGKTLLGRDAIGYLANCIYRTEDPDLNLNPLSWTLQFYARIPTSIPILASHDANAAYGGWYLALSSTHISLMGTRRSGTIYYSYPILTRDFPEGLTKNEAKHYAFVKEANKLKLYINYQLATYFNFPKQITAPGFSLFGLTHGKPEAYVTAGSLYCNYIRFDHNYVTPVDEFTKFSEDIPREVALSLFDPEAVDPDAFDTNKLRKVRNFSPPLTDADFVGAEWIIPPLTADVGTVYTVAASDVYSASYPAWKAFPGANYVPTSTALWASSTAVGDKWLSIKRNDGQPFLINAFRVNDGTLDGYRGLDYTLQGKMEADATWTDLYEVIDEPSSGDFSHYFPNIGVHSYSQYRLLFKRYALDTKRMAVSLFQLYYVEATSGSKSFEFSDNSKEVTFVKIGNDDGNYIKSVSFASEVLPRTFNLVLNDGTTLDAGQQDYIVGGTSYPWGDTGGYLAKDGNGDYYTKPLIFEGFTVTDTNGGKTVTYAAASPIHYSVEGMDVYTIAAAPATEFMKIRAANRWTDVALETKKLDSSSVVSATVKRLAAGTYLVRGWVTMTSPSGAVAKLTKADGTVLLHGLGSYAGKTGDNTIQVPIIGEIKLLTETDVVLKVISVVATKTSVSLASNILIKSEHTKLNFFKV